MPNPELYNRLCDFDQDSYRNIVSLRESEDLFDDIDEGDDFLRETAISAEIYGKRALPAADNIISRSMAYNEAILYPFTPLDPPLYSRYSDGSFPAWYGSLEWETTVHETAWHFYTIESGREGASLLLYRERKLYLVHCRGLLLDLRGKETDFPDLIADDYAFCRQIGARCHTEGIPGILAASARQHDGVNLSVFRREALSNARVAFFLTYELDLRQQTVTVTRGGDEPPLVLTY